MMRHEDFKYMEWFDGGSRPCRDRNDMTCEHASCRKVIRDLWRVRRFCPGCAICPVRGDDDRLDLSATYRLYSTCLRPNGRGCHAANSRTGLGSRGKTTVPSTYPNKEAGHANRSRLPDERDAGNRSRESRVHRPGVLFLFPGMPSAFHGEPATVCTCSESGTARARWRRGLRARLMNAALAAFVNRWRPVMQWIARSMRGTA